MYSFFLKEIEREQNKNTKYNRGICTDIVKEMGEKGVKFNRISIMLILSSHFIYFANIYYINLYTSYFSQSE